MFVNRPNLAARPQTSATTTRRGVGSTSSVAKNSGIIGKPPPSAPSNSHNASSSRLPSTSISLVSGATVNRPSTQGGIPHLKSRSMSVGGGVQIGGISAGTPVSNAGVTSGGVPVLLNSLARPPTAPSRILNPAARGRSRFKFDDKTYISILKSDILRLQRKLDDLGTNDPLSARSSSSSSSSSSSQTNDASKMTSSEEIEKFLNDFEFRAGCKTQNQMTKASLMDVLFEKMQLVEKYILEKTCDDSESEFKKFDSNLSRIGLFFNLIEKTLRMHEKLTSHTKISTPNGKQSKAQPLVAFEMPSFKVTTPPDHKLKKQGLNAKENLSGTQSSLSTTGGGSKTKEENKRLKKQVAELKRKCQRLKESERDLQKQIKDLKDQHAEGANDLTQDYKKRISDLESTVKELQSLNDKLQKKYDTKAESTKDQEKQNKSARQALVAEIGTLKKENQKLSTSSTQLQNRINSLESDLQKAKSEGNKKSSTDDALQEQLKKHAKELEVLQKKHKQQMDDASSTISKLQQQCKDLEKQLKQQDLTQQFKELQEKYQSLEKECAKLKKLLAEKPSEPDNSADLDALIRVEKELMDLKDAHNMKLKSHEVETTKFKTRITELESTLNQLQDSSRELKLAASADSRELKRLREIEEKYTTLQREVRNITSMQKQDEESLKRLAQMQEYLEKMEREYKDLQMELEKQMKRNEVLKNCDALYQESMQELRIERQKRKDLEEKSVSADRVRRLNEKVMNAEQIIREKNETIAKMEQKKASQEDAIARMRKEIQRLLDDVESRDQRIEQLEEAKKDMLKHQQPQENTNKNTDLSQIMDHIKRADQSLNDTLVEEMRSMRVAFQEKLKLSTEEIERIKQFHKKQLLEMQEIISRERQVNDKKLQQLRERCDMLTKAVEAIKVKYLAAVTR